MPMRWPRHCRLPIDLRQLPVGRGGLSPHTQARCVTQLQTSQGRLDTRTSFLDLAGVSSSCVVAARKYHERTTTLAFVAPQSDLKTSLGSVLADHTQHESKPNTSSMLKDLETTNEATGSSLTDLAIQLKRKRSRFAIQEKGKENKLLVNQLLKDKGRLSYDWRVPMELLEHHYEFQKSQSPDTDVSLFRNVVPNDDTASEYRGPGCIRRIKTCNPKEAKLAREIPIPSVWSETTLADYVEDLVEYEYRKDAICRVSQLPEKGHSNIADITTALNSVFTSPTTKRYLTIQAYTVALRFLYDNGLVSRARALYIQMEDSRMDVPTKIYNLVLRGSPSSRDLHNFTFMLQKCLQRGFKPDIETWNVLLTTISSSEVRAVIVQRMRGLGMLDSLPASGNALRLIVQQEVGSHIDKLGDRGALLDHMDNCYGSTWLTTSTGNKLLYEFGKRRSMSETLDLLPGMKLRGWSPDEISLDMLLRQSLLLRQHKYAIKILEHFRYHFRVEPGKIAHETLFLLAWRSHLLNFARVVWVSACTSGHVTFKMRNSVFQSLLSKAAVRSLDGSLERFKKLAGEFVVGANNSKEVAPLGPGGISEEQGPITRQSVVKYAQMRLQINLLAAGSPRIEEDLGKLLLRALELDMEWVATKFLSTADLQQVLQSGIQIRRAISHSQRSRLRVEQPIAREKQKARVIRKVGSSAKNQEPIRSPTRTDYTRSFQQPTVVRLGRVRGVRIRKPVVVFDAKAPSRGHLPINQEVAQETQKAGVHPKLGDSMKLRESLQSSTRSHYTRIFRKLKSDNRRQARVKQTRKQRGPPDAKASSARAERPKVSHAPAVGMVVCPLNLPHAQSAENPDSRISPRSIAGRIKPKNSAGLVRRKFRKRKPMPSSDAVFPVSSLIRTHPIGDALVKISTDPYVTEPPTPPALRMLSSDLVENDPTPRPLIRKPLAVRGEPIHHTIRKHLAIVLAKHKVLPGVRKATVKSDGKPLSGPLETAHIHSSLDKVLDLSEALHRGAKSNKSNVVEGENVSLQTRLADQEASSTEEAPKSVKFRRCLPRERPYHQS